MIDTLTALDATDDTMTVLAYSMDDGRTWTMEEPRPASAVINRIHALTDDRDGQAFLWMARLDSDAPFTRTDFPASQIAGQMANRQDAITVTARVLAAAQARAQKLIEANSGPGEWTEPRMQRAYLAVVNSASVWAESPRRIVADVPDSRSAKVHASGIVAYLLDIDVSEHGAPTAWRDTAVITELSPTRAVLTF